MVKLQLLDRLLVRFLHFYQFLSTFIVPPDPVVQKKNEVRAALKNYVKNSLHKPMAWHVWHVKNTQANGHGTESKFQHSGTYLKQAKYIILVEMEPKKVPKKYINSVVYT